MYDGRLSSIIPMPKKENFFISSLSMALQSFVGQWPLFNFLNPTHSP
jgi:hypothetical protein